MNPPLHILVLEDSAIDAELIIEELRGAGFDPLWTRVKTEKDYLAALDPAPDLILADYSLPQFDGLRALKLLRERRLDIPFILVSGMIGEEAAVEVMKHGATDYLLKDRIARLGNAVSHALEEQRLRAEKRLAESRFRSIFHYAAAAMAVTLPDGHFAEVNRAYCEMLGYTEPELLATTFEDLTHPDDRLETAIESHRQLVAGEIQSFRTEKRYLHKRGNVIWCDLSVSVVTHPDGTPAYFISQAYDITARKRVEEQIRNLNQELESRVLERTAELRETVQALEVEILKRQRLEREILEISEREQCRLGQDLHDGLGQELAGIAMLGDAHARQLTAESHPAAQAAGHIASYIRAAIESTRMLAKGLYPIDLDRYGLLLALTDLADQTSRRAGIHCELRQTGAVPPLEKSAEIHIYRIVQECIGNAVKHGNPRHITIESLAGDGSHTFSVTDDGDGFQEPMANSGMGLHLMKYRARLIGAHIRVEHPEQGGCQVSCRLTV